MYKSFGAKSFGHPLAIILSIICIRIIPTPPVFSQSQTIVIPNDNRQAAANLLTFEEIITLTSSAVDSTAITVRSRTCLTPDGRYIVGPTLENSSFLVYNSTGEFINRIGQKGDALGEFEYITNISSMPDDRLLVFDNALRRVSILSRRLRVQKVVKLPGILSDAVITTTGTIVLNMDIASQELVGIPFHHLSIITGSLSSPFGDTADEYDPSRPWLVQYTIGPGPNGSIWSGKHNEYLMEKWTTAGDKIISIRREVPWYSSWQENDYSFAEPPKPQIVDLTEDNDNRLWVIVGVPANTWQPLAETGEQGPPLPSDIDIASDSYLEIIDLHSMSVLASIRIDNPVYSFLAPGVIVQKKDSEGGNVVVVVSKVTLKRTP